MGILQRLFCQICPGRHSERAAASGDSCQHCRHRRSQYDTARLSALLQRCNCSARGHSCVPEDLSEDLQKVRERGARLL